MKRKDNVITFLFAGIGYMLFCSSLPSLAAAVCSQLFHGHVNSYYAVFSFCAGVAFVTILYRSFGEKMELFKNISPKGVMEAVGIGLVLFLVVNFIVSPALFSVFPTSEAHYAQTVTGMFETPAATFFQVVVVAPVMEELIFRGFLLKRELRSRPAWMAVILISLYFGVLHLNLVQCISAAAAGAVLCVFYRKKESVGLNILAHGFYNGMAFGLMYLFGGVA